ncbi:type VII secretion target [Streptomyces sp. NPDC003077]|uniref:WXG100 family type VII secretion target n=1 Tax=Streptomyces sp. NPDC003077 TaxID=3154443 RepID=UPI0033AC62CE
MGEKSRLDGDGLPDPLILPLLPGAVAPSDMGKFNPPGQPPARLGGPGLQVEPGVLRQAAGAADGVFEDFRKPAASLEEPMSNAAGKLVGWETARALKTAAENWERQAGAVTAWIANISESLQATARNYQASDDGIEGYFRHGSRGGR